MLAAGALKLSLVDAAFFVPPPQWPVRPPRRDRGPGRRARAARAVLNAMHRELATALRDRPRGGTPSVSARYPY